jgi:tripartite ATP-independent transporter DctM subunit
MEFKEVLAVLMFAGTIATLMAGFPVALTLAGTALVFAGLGYAFAAFDFAFVGVMAQRVFGTMTNEVLIAVPLFVFMGVMLERSRVAEDLLVSMGRLFGTLRGGLTMSVTVVGGLLAASTGIAGATVVTMGLLALPTMLKHRYDPALATGTIAAAGTLGQIIPPSIVLVLVADVLGNAYIAAQRQQGIIAIDTMSVSDLFAGALIPGLMLVGLFLAYQILIAWLKPESSPAIPAADADAGGKTKIEAAMTALIPPVLLIIAVLGSILGGVATATEAAAVGSIGALLLAGLRVESAKSGLPVYLAVAGMVGYLVATAVFDLRLGRSVVATRDQIGIGIAAICCAALAFGIAVSLWRVAKTRVLIEVMRSTTLLTAMVFLIVIAAGLFSTVFRGLGGDDLVHRVLSNLPGGAAGALFLVMAVIFVLGFFLDVVEIIFIVLPIVAPVLFALKVDPVWLGVMVGVNLQTAYLTPPFGLSLFFLRGVAPPEVPTGTIYRGIVPFVALQLLALFLVALLPGTATWLPKLLFGS